MSMTRRVLGSDGLLRKSDVPEGRAGYHYVERFTIDEDGARLANLRMAMSGAGHRQVRPGEYTRLCRGVDTCATTVMSDTDAEMRDHFNPVLRARDDCLVHGLGLGVVTEAMLRKEEVRHVTVIEYSREVIDLVAPHLERKWGTERLDVICADALTWRPPKGQRYGVVWHDIWDAICADNLEQMKYLHRRYGGKADWQGSWAREQIR